jgi:hypothetical protein
MATKASKEHSHYQIKISLLDSPLPIWRRLLIDPEMPLDIVHEVFQIAMGWWDYHLYEFQQENSKYGDLADADGDMSVQDASAFLLNGLLKKPGDNFIYAYDFGDDWTHKVVLERRASLSEYEDAVWAKCLHGRRACPPEDCFGVSGYAALLDAIEDPLHPERKEKLDWLGCTFDPDAFDARAINLRLILWQEAIEEEERAMKFILEACAQEKEDLKTTRKKNGNLVVLDREKPKKPS